MQSQAQNPCHFGFQSPIRAIILNFQRRQWNDGGSYYDFTLHLPDDGVAKGIVQTLAAFQANFGVKYGELDYQAVPLTAEGKPELEGDWQLEGGCLLRARYDRVGVALPLFAVDAAKRINPQEVLAYESGCTIGRVAYVTFSLRASRPSQKRPHGNVNAKAHWMMLTPEVATPMPIGAPTGAMPEGIQGFTPPTFGNAVATQGMADGVRRYWVDGVLGTTEEHQARRARLGQPAQGALEASQTAEHQAASNALAAETQNPTPQAPPAPPAPQPLAQPLASGNPFG